MPIIRPALDLRKYSPLTPLPLTPLRLSMNPPPSSNPMNFFSGLRSMLQCTVVVVSGHSTPNLFVNFSGGLYLSS